MKKTLSIIFSFIVLSSNSLANEYFHKVKKDYESLMEKKYILLPHKGNYLMPFVYNSNPNNSIYSAALPQDQLSKKGEITKDTEAEFQLSFSIVADKNIFKTEWDLFISYTQKSFWQVYNSAWSKPFRETNYAPEIYLRRIFDKPIEILGLKFVLFDAGLIHQSNGQIQALSRSWDRIFVRTAFIKNRFTMMLDLWYRLPERSSEDENKSIYKYRGYGELRLAYGAGDNFYQLRILPGTYRQGVELEYSYPINDAIRFFTKISHGYGLSLQDFDHESQKIGIGFSLGDPFTNNPDKTNSWFL